MSADKTFHLYCVHYTPATFRKKSIDVLVQTINKVNNLNLTCNYITDYDSHTVDISKIPINKNLIINKYHACRFLKHFDAITKISHLPEEEVGVIIEDDVIFQEKDLERLPKIVSSAGDANILFLSLPHSFGDQEKEVLDFQNFYKHIPDTAAYAITPKTAKIILTNLNEIHNTYPSQLNSIIIKENIHATFCYPMIFLDSSKTGHSFGMVSFSGNLPYCTEFMNIYKEDDIVKTKSHMENLPEHLKNHPSILNVYGYKLMKAGKYKEADDSFNKCLKFYENIGVEIPPFSLILKNKIINYKYL